MPRLTKAQWEQARADYEVRGETLAGIAKEYGVTAAAVFKTARRDGWIQGESKCLVSKKVNAIKELAEVESKSKSLPPRHRFTIDAVVKEELQARGMLAAFDVALAHKGIMLAKEVTSADEWETLARGRRHIAPVTEKQQPGVNVNVNQQQAQGTALLPPPSPQPHEAVRGVLRGDFEGDE